MLRRIRVAVALLPLVLTLVVVQSLADVPPSAGAQSSDDDVTVIHAYMSDYDFVLDRTIIPAGRVRFEVLNISNETRHEVWIYPIEQRDTARFHEMLHLKRTGQRADERDFVDGVLGSSGEVQAGEAATFEAVFPPGLYEVGCLARDGDGDERLVHHDRGMFAALAVRPSM